MIFKKWMLALIFASLGVISACSDKNTAEISGNTSGEKVSSDGTVIFDSRSDSAGEETYLYDEAVIPDPEDLKYAKNIPENLDVDFTSHDPLFLWKHRDYTPYWDSTLGGVEEPHLIPYLIGDGKTRGCVIVCPGGAYGYRESSYEGSTVAEFINSSWNMQAVVLEYRVKPADYRGIICDVLRAVRYVRYYAEDLGVDPDRIVVMGFSAGGHLACMAAEKFDYGKAGDVIDHVSSRPDAAILCYPVISLSAEWKHTATAENFFGALYGDDTLAEDFSGELAVREDMPPVFVFHSKKDSGVDYRNSQMLAEAMEKLGLSCELKLYENGDHGVSLALGYGGGISEWTSDCLAWLREVNMK